MTDSQNTHTPGPWYGKHSVYTDQGIIASESTGATIAACYTNAADTRLIAASPKLLHYLKMMIEWAESTVVPVVKDSEILPRGFDAARSLVYDVTSEDVTSK
jgi:hypothetical protein